jgi:heme/copper-type cytochrome/quinol oxidase subunit 2
MDDDFHPPLCAQDRCRDLTSDFIGIVLVPVVLLVIVAVILAVLLFRKKTKRFRAIFVRRISINIYRVV